MHLIVPFASVDADGARDALRRLDWRALARHAPVARSDGDERSLTPPHERALADAIGWARAGLRDGIYPWAALAAHDDSIDTGRQAHARITPVHWRLAADHAVLVDPQALDLGDAESRVLLDALRPLFESDGIALHYGAPLRWYAIDERFATLACASIDRVIGRAIEPWLPAMRDARFLRRLQNEAQMLLHEHALNRKREARRALPVNSFWIDGCGRALPVRRDGVRVDESLRASALVADWPAWFDAWQRLLAGPIAAQQATDRLTLCGERSAQQLQRGGGAGWWRALVPGSAAVPAWLPAL